MQVGPELAAVSDEDLASSPAAARALLVSMAARITALEARVIELERENVALRAENALLREKLRLNSSNSGKPPSSDGPAAVACRGPRSCDIPVNGYMRTPLASTTRILMRLLSPYKGRRGSNHEVGGVGGAEPRRRGTEESVAARVSFVRAGGAIGDRRRAHRSITRATRGPAKAA